MEQNNQLEKKEIIYSLVNREYIQPHFKDDISLKNCTKLKIEQIGMLGAAFVPVTSFLSQVNEVRRNYEYKYSKRNGKV